MKMNIKTTIGIIAIAIAISSMSIAQAGEHSKKRGSDHNYEKPRQERNFSRGEHRGHWKHVNNRHDRFRAKRHLRKHKRAKRIAKRHMKAHRRAMRNNHWKYGYRSSYNRGYYSYQDNYYGNYASSRPRHSSHKIVVNADPLVPIIVASKIAKKVIRHDPIIRAIVRHDPIARAIFGR